MWRTDRATQAQTWILEGQASSQSPKSPALVGLDHWCHLNALNGLETCGKPAQSGAIDWMSLRWDVPGPFPLESPGFQWLIMCQLLPGQKHYKEINTKPAFCSVLPSMAPQWGLQGRQCQEKGTDTHLGTSVYGNRPQSDGCRHISGGFYNLRSLRQWQNPDKDELCFWFFFACPKMAELQQRHEK